MTDFQGAGGVVPVSNRPHSWLKGRVPAAQLPVAVPLAVVCCAGRRKEFIVGTIAISAELVYGRFAQKSQGNRLLANRLGLAELALFEPETNVRLPVVTVLFCSR